MEHAEDLIKIIKKEYVIEKNEKFYLHIMSVTNL
jgi:hypothetical protein